MPDPADVARARSAETERLLRHAAELEAKANEDTSMEEQVSCMTWANNYRLQALCNHLRLPAPVADSEPPGPAPDGNQD